MKEEFLHFIWKFKLFNSLDLTTTEGESLEILSQGVHNHNSGPDFSNAQLLIGSTRWSGNVEIHVNSKEWYKHSHQRDDAYKNVILHVVYENDQEVYLNQPGDLPVLELKSLIPEGYKNSYEKLKESKGWVPCASQFSPLDNFKMNLWLERLMINRLQRKSSEVLRIYLECDKDWNQTLYRWIARGYGFKINSDAFEELARKAPLKILKKHAHSAQQVESILFGQAGMLEDDFEEEYPKKLQSDYRFFQKKYGFTPLPRSIWKFSKTHPSNFPTKRIAQLAAFIISENGTFSKILGLKSHHDLAGVFAQEVSSYWSNHYRFGKETNQKRALKMGVGSVNNLLINTLSTILFTYGQKSDLPEFTQKSLELLSEIKSEKNSIITNWIKLGVQIQSARDTQALIELKREFCEKKKCLSCVIGSNLIKTTN